MAKILPITIYPQPILTKKTRELDLSEINQSALRQLILDMIETLKAQKGLGLAANQVGRDCRLVVIDIAEEILVLINPKILKKSWRKEIEEEGCLSFPNIFGLVPRSRQVTVAALNTAGKKVKFIAQGILARVLQHEIDHLDGIVFIDRMKKITKSKEELEKLSHNI